MSLNCPSLSSSHNCKWSYCSKRDIKNPLPSLNGLSARNVWNLRKSGSKTVLSIPRSFLNLRSYWIWLAEIPLSHLSCCPLKKFWNIPLLLKIELPNPRDRPFSQFGLGFFFSLPVPYRKRRNGVRPIKMVVARTNNKRFLTLSPIRVLAHTEVQPNTTISWNTGLLKSCNV